MNKVMLIGNVGQDPKVTYYDADQAIAQLSLATTERGYTLQNGTQVPDRTDWHNLVFYRNLAKVVEKYVRKGDKLYIEGRIRNRSYDDKAGRKHYIAEIQVENMEMLTPKSSAQVGRDGTQPAQSSATPSAEPQKDNHADRMSVDEGNSKLPF